MKRTGALTAGLLTAVVAVTGCGTGTDASGTPDAGTNAGAGPTVVRVAAASDLKFALDDLLKDFHEEHPGTTVEVSYGSSGNFSTQLFNGAPFDVFLSADTAYPEMLREAGLTVEDSQFDYAVGRLVVWAGKDKKFGIEAEGLDRLTGPDIRRIAIANPDHAPYGVAAVAALKSAGVYEEVKGKLVMGDNIAQAAEFVTSGNADAGVIALSLAEAGPMKDRGDVAEVDLESYPRINQGGVIMKKSSDVEAAKALATYLTGPGAQEVLKSYGFFLPGQ
ncbi:molybdate ABC transporter substrate-binding protein [Streptomyces sp. ACA25]|uniref:molybdate ABC transporter substrate-binding protein n=1 Tax=Streptomyces sp. ACA25 TaxID=3022596 RepID=UPI002307124A|nr:molybdate ABC transporter substrate-binding protein [Streptomyces sp. ACA25]MDB1089954.1 molybdate ABC transporter substrate-binding protein [Streptomyces sp. ACA25]